MVTTTRKIRKRIRQILNIIGVRPKPKSTHQPKRKLKRNDRESPKDPKEQNLTVRQGIKVRMNVPGYRTHSHPQMQNIHTHTQTQNKSKQIKYIVMFIQRESLKKCVCVCQSERQK